VHSTQNKMIGGIKGVETFMHYFPKLCVCIFLSNIIYFDVNFMYN
jgi:hypothetical protein